jgi:REP element-mobilizing transposase RayT
MPEQSPKRERGVRKPRVRDRPVADAPGSGGGLVADAPGSDGGLVADAPASDHNSVPMAYLITFTTYGTWLHGDRRGSVDREHNVYGLPHLGPNPRRTAYESCAQKAKTVTLDDGRRDVVRSTIIEVCSHRGWSLHELNVRSNHVHVVVSAPCPPERVLNDFKAWATRRLRETGQYHDRRSPWSEHGSKRYLWKPHQLEAACRYALDGQGLDL